jgi:hypothetical protein
MSVPLLVSAESSPPHFLTSSPPWPSVAVYEVLSTLPRHGVGSRLQKKTWHEDSYWDVIKVQMDLSGASGKSYGVLTWRGTKVHEEPRRIPGTRKKVWRVVDSGVSDSQSGSSAWRPMDTVLLNSLAADAVEEGSAAAEAAVEAAVEEENTAEP